VFHVESRPANLAYWLPQANCAICYDYVNANPTWRERMPITTHDIRQALMESNQEYRKLFEEHSRCESQLQQLVGQSYWNVEDLEMEVSLKKMKLRLKDMMELIVASYHSQMVHH
jgi:uncharacterized protein YdcH (DUF465 family)